MKTKKIITLLFFIVLTISANAQKRWNWTFQLGASQNSGNVENFSLKNYGEIKRNDSTLAFMANYKHYIQKEEKVETNKGFEQSLKFDIFQYDRWSPFVAYEYLSNKYKGYDFKMSGLAGVKLRIYHKNDTCDYSISVAAVYDYVNYTDEETELNKNLCRLSIRPKLKQKISNALTISHTTFYQPNFRDFGDYLVISKTAIENKITSKMFIDISFNYEYRSLLPTDKYSHYDISTDVTLKLKF